MRRLGSGYGRQSRFAGKFQRFEIYLIFFVISDRILRIVTVELQVLFLLQCSGSVAISGLMAVSISFAGKFLLQRNSLSPPECMNDENVSDRKVTII